MDEETCRTSPSSRDTQPVPTLEGARRALKECFGYADFRPGQKSVIEALIAGRDALAVMPTGAGKSLCYQIPSLVLPGVAIVVSPLVSLMGDQVRALVQAGVHAAYLNSTLSPAAQGRVIERARAGGFDIIYVAPERLEDARFVEFASRARIALIAVDEAHCVSQWGQDFRPSYLQIGAFIAQLPTRPAVCALTATATERVRDDIVRLLGLSDPYRIVTGFDRPNLHFAVERAEPKRKLARIAAYALEHASDSGIVYCSTRKDTEAVCDALVSAGVRATRYHAGLPAAERAANQQAFICDDAPVMVATNAIGMGIDKSNVRYVLHHNMPASIEAYYQEAGRAGRDGLPSECLLFWSEKDLSTCRFFIEQESSNEELSPEEAEAVRQTRRRMLAAMEGYCVTCGCLREYLLRYFGEKAAAGGPAKCGNCGNCEGGFERVDVTSEARAIMRCVQELRGEWGKGMVADVLRGSKSEKVLSFGLDHANAYGTLFHASAAHVKDVIELLVAGRYLDISEGKFPKVGFGPNFRAAAAPEFSLFMKRVTRKSERVGAGGGHAFGSSGTRGTRRAGTAADSGSSELFERLRALRKQIASERGCAPYMVFSDAALRDMCARLPQTEDEFLEVNGVGQTKLERYGKAFLAEIAAFENR